MSYAIIRNAKYKRENLKGIFRHNERKNVHYSNENIDKEKSYLNYSLKAPKYSYEKEFDRIKEKYNLKGQIKTVSNIACEYIITSDHDFFENIGEEETKRFFETAYKFVAEYKDLGEQYIMSSTVHMDEQTPNMHLVFLPVVHTTDKKGHAIDKLACSEFWKAKDSYRQLQDAFFKYMVENGFVLQRGVPIEETNRKHYSVEEYKQITNYKQTKKTLENIKLELPDVPEITDINVARWSKKRDEKILEEIIKPKDDLIQNLYQNNLDLHRELTRQTQVIEEAEKYQKERDKILADNEELHNSVKIMEKEYKKKSNTLDLQFSNRKRDLEIEFKEKESKLKSDWMDIIDDYKKENKHLKRVVDTFKKTIKIFIKWICKKFDIAEDYALVRDFEKETHISLDAEKQVQKEDREKEWDLEM